MYTMPVTENTYVYNSLRYRQAATAQGITPQGACDVLNDHVKNPNRNISQNNLHTFGRAELITSRARRMSP